MSKENRQLSLFDLRHFTSKTPTLGIKLLEIVRTCDEVFNREFSKALSAVEQRFTDRISIAHQTFNQEGWKVYPGDLAWNKFDHSRNKALDHLTPETHRAFTTAKAKALQTWEELKLQKLTELEHHELQEFLQKNPNPPFIPSFGQTSKTKNGNNKPDEPDKTPGGPSL